MQGRQATNIEVEMAEAICNLQDELYEAKRIITSLLRSHVSETQKQVDVRKRAIKFLKGKKDEQN